MDSRERRQRRRERNKQRKRQRILILLCLAVIAIGAILLSRLLKKNEPVPLPTTEAPVTAATEAPTTSPTEPPTTTEATEAKEATETTETAETEPLSETVQTENFGNTLEKFMIAKNAVTITEEPGRGGAVRELPAGAYVQTFGTVGGYTKVNHYEHGGFVPASELEEVQDPDTFKVVEGVLVVNKKYRVPSDYDPGLKTEVMIQFEKMKADMATEGMVADIGSGYRSYEYQLGVIERNIARYGEEETKRTVAPAGHSEHQTGLAIDIINDEPETNIEPSFAHTKEGEWLAQNSYKYGFILRYPEGKEEVTGYAYEPWHFRYVGEEMAARLFDSGKTIEEYFNLP